MTKRRRAAVEAVTSSQEEYGGESISKKKKKRRSESQDERSEASRKSPPMFDISFSQLSSSPSPGLSPSKKKKKKRRAEQEEEEDAAVNGTLEKIMFEEEQKAEEGKRKRKKKQAVIVVEDEEEEEEEAAAAAAAAAATRSRRRKREKEEEPLVSKEEEEEEEEEEEAVVKKSTKKNQKKMKTSVAAAAGTSTTLASKRKMKPKVDEEEDEGECSFWPEESIRELLARVTQQMPPEGKDTRSSRVTIKTVDWVAAAPPGYSPKASREEFLRLYKKMNLYKTLTSVLKEMLSLVESGLKDRRNRPKMPMHRFLKEYLTAEKKAAAKRTGENILKVCSDAWMKLPGEKKEKYKRSYKEDIARLKPKATDKSDLPVKLPKLPHQICWDAQSSTTSAVRSRSHYASLTPEEQLPFIRKSLEDMMRYPADLDTYRETHPDYEPPSCHALPKVDLKTYLSAYGCPDLPPPRSTQIFYREALEKGLLNKVPGAMRMAAAMTMFKGLSEQEKDRCRKKQEEEQQKYEQQLKQWQSEQDDVTLFALKNYKKINKYNPNKNVAKDKSHHVKADDVFPHKAPSITSCPKFIGEPPRPVASPYRLFTLKFRASADTNLSGPELQRALKDGWKALTQDEEAVYISRCRILQKLYEKEVKDYVRRMDTKDRRTFLGFNRVHIFRIFGNRDVFAEEFPNSEEYPVFVKGLQQQPSSPTKPQTDYEEEEDFNSAIPIPKKRLGAVPFSSLKSPPPPIKKQPPAISLGKKSKAPQASVSESEDSSEEEDNVQVIRHSAPSPAHPKKKLPAATAGKKTKAAPARRAPVSESESESEEEDSDEAEDITPARHSVSTRVQPKKNLPAATAGKKTKAAPARRAPVSESESEEEDSDEAEDITPAWHSVSTRVQPKRQQQDVESSSSGFSDSEVDE